MRKNQKVVMSENAIENYGEQWRNIVLIITHVARNKNEHPGYDDGVSPQCLYDLKREDNGEDLNMSLYDWELVASR